MENEKGLSIVCREIDKNSGQIATYLCKKSVNDSDLVFCQMRAKFNPELRYYVIRDCVANNPELLEETLSLLKRRNLTNEMIKRYGGIVAL